MTRLCTFLKSSIGLKVIMAVTGTALCLFLLIHMAGNLLILVDPVAFNNYAHSLTSNKFILYSAEAGLLAIFILHIVVAIALTKRNRAARPIPYAVKTNSGLSRRTWYSSNMIITGTFMLAFIPIHLMDFKFGDYFTITTPAGMEIRDLARTVIEEFSEVGEVIFYVIAMLVIAFHLLHGVQSMFASYGIETNRTHRLIYMFSRAFVVIVMGGFLIIPLVLFVRGQ